jgi:hypothetical protein
LNHLPAHNHLISVKTIADYHLEEFMRCPYQFYQKQILGKRVTRLHWREMVQYAVNQVVEDYYKLPPQSRSAYKVMELIQRHWIKKVDLFASKIDYYLVLANVTDHLLHCLLEAKDADVPVLLFEKLRVYLEELQVELAMTFQVVEWSAESYIVKKFFVEENENILTSFKHMAVFFCKKAFQSLPERIDAVSLLTGATHRFYPQPDDVPKALEYLQFTKNLLQESKNYPKCHACSLQDKSNLEQSRKKKEMQLVM